MRAKQIVRAMALGGAALLVARRNRRPASLRGERVLVTGGSRGLGFLLARELLERGCGVAICARDAGELEQARAGLSGRVFTVVCDVADRNQVDAMIAKVTDHFGGIDTLIDNAGMIEVGPVEAMRPEDFERALDVMFWGVLYPILAVLPQMRARRAGRIAVVTSIGGRIGVPHLLPYGCAKFAAVGLSEGLRAELADCGITVTTAVPGLMRTGSYVNAQFRGRADAEFAWFGLGASLPFVSMDAERAARQIVDAVARGQSDVVLSLPAKIAAAFHGLFPGTTADVLAIVDRMVLPRSSGSRRAVPGSVLATRKRWLRPLMLLGRVAARRFQPTAR